MLYSEEIEKLTNIINDFDNKFGDIDVNSLSKKDKKSYMRLKNKIDNLHLQKDMMESTLNSMKSFGVDNIQIGKK